MNLNDPFYIALIFALIIGGIGWLMRQGRSRRFLGLAKDLGYTYSKGNPTFYSSFASFSTIRKGCRAKIANSLEGHENGRITFIADYRHAVGKDSPMITLNTNNPTYDETLLLCGIIDNRLNLPHFIIRRNTGYAEALADSQNGLDNKTYLTDDEQWILHGDERAANNHYDQLFNKIIELIPDGRLQIFEAWKDRILFDLVDNHGTEFILERVKISREIAEILILNGKQAV